MKVLLIIPTFHYKDSYPAPLSLSDFPTGMAYIASSLKKAGHDVYGLNPNNIRGYATGLAMIRDILRERVADVRPDLIGLGGLCTDYAFLRDAIGIIRDIDSSIPIVLGGQIVTNDAEDIFDILKPDYAIKGEADNAIVELVNMIRNGEIPEERIIKADVPNLDELPYPDYEPFGIQEMMDKYSMATRLLYRYSRPYPRPFSILASRSCPFSCTFCVHGHDRPPYRSRSIPDVIEEIRITYDKYKYNILILLDELFAVNKKRMVEFCEAIVEGKEKYGWDFDWMFQTHASAKFDIETLKLAKKAGCFFFSYGLESASPTVLKSMNKRIKVEQVVKAIELAKEAKIGFGANLIFGDIAETAETIAESLTFWFEHCKGAFVFLADLIPYPGSQLFDDARVMDKFRDKKEYYETIDEQVINVTKIPDTSLYELRNLYQFLDHKWLFVEAATNTYSEDEGNGFSKIWGTCPYCGEESMYRSPNSNTEHAFWLGLGCTHCNSKIKVGVGNVC